VAFLLIAVAELPGVLEWRALANVAIVDEII